MFAGELGGCLFRVCRRKTGEYILTWECFIFPCDSRKWVFKEVELGRPDWISARAEELMSKPSS